ncbi:MAG: molybdopterin-dependent oxidoreductase [Eggerthellaceae bacterium]
MTNLTRRNFLKASIAAAGGVWLGTAIGCSSGPGEGGEGAQAASGETICNGVCRPNCFSTCMMNVHVREGKIVKTSPADFPDTSFNRICLRGLSHVENVHHPDRVLYPMKQTGERGSDQWERVSWDEALDEIAEKLASLREEYGDSSIFKASGSSVYHVTNGSVATFFNEINASSMTADLDKSNYLGINRVYGFAGLWPANDPHDYVNAKTMFLWGNNLTDAQIHDWHFVADAMEQGTYVVCIDPTFTQMAAKSDRFVPIRPGADLPLIMAMMYVIVEEDQVDWDFMTQHTCAPFLVKSTDGLFLRMSDLGTAPVENEDGTVVDPYVVWDPAANAAAELSTVAAPALEGTFEVEGVSCTTAYSLLKDEIMKFTPEYASTLCDVPADTIVELAHLAVDGPVTHRVGWGAQAYDNGIHPHHAGAALGALTGQLGKPGANYGPAPWLTFNGGNAAIQAASGEVTSPTVSCMHMPDVMASGTFQGEPVTPKALWVYSGNPLCTWSTPTPCATRCSRRWNSW